MKKAIHLSILSFLFVFATGRISAQQLSEAECANLVQGALGGANDTEDMALVFEGIAFGLAKPQEIFSLPVYKMHRGGYLYTRGDKYEINLGVMKALSDGKVMVVVDELGQMLYLDSLQRKMPAQFEMQATDLAASIGLMLGDASMRYEGTEVVHGEACHKVRSSTSGGEMDSHSYFWIARESGRLLLMADWNGQGYDTYWVQSVGHTPKGHDFSLQLPSGEVTELYGYKVIDMRHAAVDMYKRN